MRSKLSRRVLVVLLAAVLAAVPSAIARSQSAVDDAIGRVRDRVHALDPHGALGMAAAGVEAHPESVALRAWWLVAMAQSGLVSRALDEARALTEANAEDGWAWLALAAAQMEGREESAQAADSSARALELLGEHPDALWTHARALIAGDRYDEAIELTSGDWSDPALAAVMARQRSRALYYEAGFREPDPELRRQALETARLAVDLAPESTDAVLGLATLLEIAGAVDESREVLARVRELSPSSIPVRQRYWQSIVRRSDLEPEHKLTTLRADFEDLLERHTRSAAALYAAHGALREVNAPELRNSLEEEILSRHPDSPEAELIVVSRYRNVGQELYSELRRLQAEGSDADPDPEVVLRYRQALESFLEREEFHRPVLRGDAYRELFGISRWADGVSAEDLLEIVEGMVAWEGINVHISHAQGPIALAERTGYYERAEEIVREGFNVARERLERQRGMFDSAEFDRVLDSRLSTQHDALGWVLFQADRIDEAEPELLQAHELNPENLANLHHLGQLYEHTGDRATAERFYVLGLKVQRPGANPNREALEALYERDHGSLDGFDAYLEEIAVADAEARRTEILESRIDEPQPVPAFELTTLDGDTVGLEDLRGKIVVVNFWGIWCYWCVIEMPEVQELHERYADDPDVLVVTINNDPNPDQVPVWMTENGYTFPVLLDDGYVSASGIYSFPTTWFLDPDGRIAFVKEGWSQEVLQEYSWRVEAIRSGSSAAATDGR